MTGYIAESSQIDRLQRILPSFERKKHKETAKNPKNLPCAYLVEMSEHN